MSIQVQALSKSYRRLLAVEAVRALSEVTLEIHTGEIFGIIGPNGAGKTTFLGCLLGFLTPDSGTIQVDGHAPDDLEVRRVTGYLPERLVLDRWMTGRAFLGYHQRARPAARFDSAQRSRCRAGARRSRRGCGGAAHSSLLARDAPATRSGAGAARESEIHLPR
jgi:ABC-type multidrug transport system ATPase subunit